MIFIPDGSFSPTATLTYQVKSNLQLHEVEEVFTPKKEAKHVKNKHGIQLLLKQATQPAKINKLSSPPQTNFPVHTCFFGFKLKLLCLAGPGLQVWVSCGLGGLFNRNRPVTMLSGPQLDKQKHLSGPFVPSTMSRR